jgi:hypothetical protein
MCGKASQMCGTPSALGERSLVSGYGDSVWVGKHITTIVGLCKAASLGEECTGIEY